MKIINLFMLLVASVVIGTTVPLSTYASTKQLSSTDRVQYVYKHNLKTIKIFNNDMKMIQQYQKSALKSNDMKMYKHGKKVEKKVLKSYNKNILSRKFDDIAQQYLITYRFEYQRNSNPQSK